jgi:hypothetical protein
MALKTWWDGDDAQRYWMEVATTGAMGEILIAPKFPGSTWSYNLVGEVRPGDRVLHWRATSEGRALVGWSVATAAPEVVPEYTWQPRGTSGRALGGPRTTEGWMVTLGGFNAFTEPLLSSELQQLRDDVLRVGADLEASYGKPTYFPFYLYGGRELRAQQGYLVKFPAELLAVLPTIDEAEVLAHRSSPDTSVPEEEEVTEDSQPEGKTAPRGGVTRIQDPELRSAIENHAVDVAIEHYEELGGTDFVKLGKPYDVRLSLDGDERHVEVKGSSMRIDTVDLTINEVAHAEAFQPTDLVVVDNIEWEREADGGVSTYGGRLRKWSDWEPDDGDLAPRRFAYSLPSAESYVDDPYIG